MRCRGFRGILLLWRADWEICRLSFCSGRCWDIAGLRLCSDFSFFLVIRRDCGWNLSVACLWQLVLPVGYVIFCCCCLKSEQFCSVVVSAAGWETFQNSYPEYTSILHQWCWDNAPIPDTKDSHPPDSQIHDRAHYQSHCNNSSNPNTANPSSTKSDPLANCHSNADIWITPVFLHSGICSWWYLMRLWWVLGSFRRRCQCRVGDPRLLRS